MAIQCRICSEILVREDELQKIALDGASAGRRVKGIEIYPDFCPDCFGYVPSNALRERASAHPAAAA